MSVERETYHHGALREKLLTASLELVREVGVRGFALREVSRRSGVSHSAAYRHFRNKAELFAVITEKAFDRLREAMEKAIVGSDSPSDRLQRAGVAYVEFCQRDPESFAVMFSTEPREKLPPATREASKRCFSLLLSLVRDCLSGRSRPDAEAVALAAWAHVHSIAQLALQGHLGLKTRSQLIKFAELATAIFVRGVGK
jgi:AcrR family transcriptional regulator